MNEPRHRFPAFTVNVMPDPYREGEWRWTIQSNGKLICKSRRKLTSEAQAKRDAQGVIETLLEDRMPE